MVETILVCAAHADDAELGAGGTIAKYAQEGKRVITVVFSFGEKSSPWLKEEIIIANRKKEAKEIGTFLGCAETIFLGLADTKLQEEIKDPKIKEIMKRILQRFQPSKVFVLSASDPHPDHRATHTLTLQAVEEFDKEKKIQVYTYEVWNVVSQDDPVIYVDVTKTFKTKLAALRKFKSQKVSVYMLIVPVVIRALLSGLRNKCRFAEKFYRIR